jgi:hypothetical protein
LPLGAVMEQAAAKTRWMTRAADRETCFSAYQRAFADDEVFPTCNHAGLFFSQPARLGPIFFFLPGELVSRGFRRKRSDSAAHVGSREECAREGASNRRGYGGLGAGSWKPVGSSWKPVGIVVGIVVGSLNFRLEGGWKAWRRGADVAWRSDRMPRR